MTEARRRIAVVTTSRADYSHLYWPLRLLAEDPRVELKLIVMGAHLSPDFGETIKGNRERRIFNCHADRVFAEFGFRCRDGQDNWRRYSEPCRRTGRNAAGYSAVDRGSLRDASPRGGGAGFADSDSAH